MALPKALRRAAPGRERPRLTVLIALGMLVVAMLAAVSTFARLELPSPSGTFAVGRQHLVFSDPTRLEPRTSAPQDHRQVPVTLWFPAEVGSGKPSPYVDRLAVLREGLLAGGDLSAAAVLGLRFVRDTARSGAVVSPERSSYPLVLLSPGNATNVDFYATIAEELASHGFVVAGVDHPFQSAAVLLGDESVATYEGDPPLEDAEKATAARITERVRDLRLVLDTLTDQAATLLNGRIDLSSVGVMGHSNGGIAAVQACREDPRIDACMNIDGQQRNGPFPTDGPPTAPPKPFLYLTKEQDLHPALLRAFDAGGEAGHGTFRIVVPAASHEQFTDGALFGPTVNPLTSTAQKVLIVARGAALAFFDHSLRAAPRSVFHELRAPTDVFVAVHPLPAKSDD